MSGIPLGDDPKRSSMRASTLMGDMGKAGKGGIRFAKSGVKGTIKGATALPGSAVKGVGNAAKFGVNATTFVAKVCFTYEYIT